MKADRLPLVELRDIKKRYMLGNVKVNALDGLNLTIGTGEFVALMGPSGSGKSTLLNLIGLLDRPTAGQLLIEGTETSSLNNNQRADFRLKKIGYVFQFFSLLLELTAYENVALPMMIEKRNYIERSMDLLTMVGLKDRVLHKPNELSGGQQQRVAIARALANKPTILLADEPTANLDMKSAREIVELFRMLNKNGQTIIMVTHEPELGKLANRIIKLIDGRIDDQNL